MDFVWVFLRMCIDLQLTNKLPITDKLPNVDLRAVGQHIANDVTGDGLAIIAGQQIAPGRIVEGIIDCTLHRTQCAGGVGIFLFARNIASVIIGPDPGLACGLIILSGQLVGGVIFVGSGIGAVTYGDDIAVGIVVVHLGLRYLCRNISYLCKNHEVNNPLPIALKAEASKVIA